MMNDTLMKRVLNHAPETTVKVSTSLHQDIMRAVRLAEPSASRSGFTRAIPVLGAIFIAMLVAGMIFFLPTKAVVSPSPTTVQTPPQTRLPADAVMVLGENLVGMLKDSPPPEDKLRQELERLKSDLERFDFRI